MIYICCTNCNAVLRVSPGEDDELESLVGEGSGWYPNKYPCPMCDGLCEFRTALEPDKYSASLLIDLSAKEAFVAFCGAGLPDEQDCGEVAVQQIFSKEVSKVVTRTIRGSRRCIIDHIEFKDGSRAYLGSSAYGATVFRISKPHSYAKAVEGG